MVELSKEEVLEVEGGSVTAVILGVFTILSGYTAIREMVRDQGRADAYRDLGY